ncbi:MAG: uracil-DNA glycosylase [Burkholderiales bacterium]|nr:uracil-DNA glycosylase [Burkholderiales bacterium]
MRWSELQRAMLREMGIPAFWPVPPQDEVADAALVSEPKPARAKAPPAAADRPAPAATGIEVVLGPRPDGIDQMDWSALRTAVAGCQACGLCQSRRQAVFGVGHEQAHWMIVGEAPGEQEDLQGEPFVGRPGQLLDRMLEAVGLTRGEADAGRQVFIANVLKCRSPENRNPQPAEVAQCEPYLMRQIALVQPRVILAMGRFAAQALLKSTLPIGKLRGQVHQVHGTPVIVTYDPAYLLRNPVDKALVWDDLCRARELLAGVAD